VSDQATQIRLRDSIRALGLTDKAFAEAGGITRQTLAGYLNTDREPSRDTLAAWVKAYNLNAHWLLTGEGEMLADHQNQALQHPLAQRVNQVALLMSESGVDELELLRAVRAMVDGEIDKLAQRRGGTGASAPQADMSRAEENSSPAAARKLAAGDDSV
jgi:transcriptional regulator with XRE-family HTH domain